jgi:hypothetical protein
MGLLGDFVKGFLIMVGAYWIYLIINFIVIGQTGLALLFTIGLIPPLSMIAYEYLKIRKKGKIRIKLKSPTLPDKTRLDSI